MAELASLKVVITGHVQGVMFRDFTRRKAEELHLKGYVKNTSADSVEIEAEGVRANLDILLAEVQRGPPRAIVEDTSVTWGAYAGKYHDFKIRF